MIFQVWCLTTCRPTQPSYLSYIWIQLVFPVESFCFWRHHVACKLNDNLTEYLLGGINTSWEVLFSPLSLAAVKLITFCFWYHIRHFLRGEVCNLLLMKTFRDRALLEKVMWFQSKHVEAHFSIKAGNLSDIGAKFDDRVCCLGHSKCVHENSQT